MCCACVTSGPGDLCEELWLQVSHPGDNTRFHRRGLGTIDHPEEQPPTSPARPSAQHYTGEAGGVAAHSNNNRNRSCCIAQLIASNLWFSLTQAWADAFRSSPDLTGVVSVYEDLRRKGLEFPMTELDGYSPVQGPKKVQT